MTHCRIEDASIQARRRSALAGRCARLFIVREHRVRIATASGEVIGPKQVSFLLGVSRAGDDLE
eukprot:1707106-Pyramimonas_sp.AAC.1